VSPNDDFRRELNNVFDDVSGSPSPALRDRVCAALAEAPAERSTYWIAAVAACVITALIVGILYVNNPFRRTGVAGPGPAPSASASPTTQPSPSPQFICTADTMEHTLPAAPLTAYVTAVRVASHSGYDRVTVEFSNDGIPTRSVELQPQANTKFPLGESGQDVTLQGKNGIHVIIQGADMHTSYSGPLDWTTSGSLVEVRQVEDVEGVVRFGLGIDGPACYHAFYLTNPYRLVIDVQSAG
jgi:hypothetical protein